MSVLHPVGPEEPRTYWVRRALVIAAVLVVLAVIISLVVSALSAGSAVQANPPPVPSPLVQPTTPSSTATASPVGHGSPTTSPTPGASRSTAAAKSTTKAKPQPKPSVTASKKAGPVACDPSEVRVTLNGKQRLKRRQDDPFQLSVINGSDRTCVVAVNRKNFELKIYSGRDRIWSTDDCSTAVKAINPKLKTQQAAAWKMIWNGRRSKANCKNRPEIPKAGTYFATAQLKGAKPVQLRMVIRG